ncbi:NADH-quinone oxidoreductase subunit N [Actinospongicola halichondriae]|uniref:NADH-quinone oxidoreductase subunit N n=1 Tax=Actinospongicola halichondriae TaxID=3236844 RepID=UPI003D41362E
MFAALTFPLQAADEVFEPIATPAVEWSAILPLLILAGAAMGLMLVTALTRWKPFNGFYPLVTSCAAIAAGFTTWPLWERVQDVERGPYSVLSGAIGIDGFSLFVTAVICSSVVLTSLLADGYLRREGMDGPDLYVLVLLSASGGTLMAGANDLIVLFLGLEILSLAVYVLAAMHLRRVTSQEAGIKYFVLGSFASAFMLYGIALTYGATGSTNLVEILDFLSSTVLFDNGLLLAGMAMLLVGLGFKVAAAPFHAWTPDVYQGSPTPVVAYMASGVKAAGFAGLIRVFYLGFGTYAADWQPIVYALALLTLVVGSIMAVVQTDVKRMLAYSSISHAGFILMAVQAASERGVEASLFYLGSYTFLVAGSFAVVAVVGREGDGKHSLDDYKGLAKSRPGLALAFSILLFSQAGVPFTSGFFAKFYAISAAVDARSFPLAMVAMFAAVIAAFLYLRITVAMWMGDDDEAVTPAEDLPVPEGVRIALTLCLLVTLGVGLFPHTLAGLASDATAVLVQFSG